MVWITDGQYANAHNQVESAGSLTWPGDKLVDEPLFNIFLALVGFSDFGSFHMI